MENENVGERVKQVEVNSTVAEGKSNGFDKKLIIKIVVGVLIFLAVVGVAIFLLIRSMVGNTVGSIVDLGTSLVDDAMDNSSDLANQVQSNINNNATSIQNSANTKTAITAHKFAEVMKAKGYEVIDTTSVFNSQYEPEVKKGYLARTSDYQIEFYELHNEADAMEMYNWNKTKFESQKGSTSSHSTMSRNNYNIYNLTTNGKYYYLSRVDNSYLHIDVSDSFKDEVKNIASELGY